ncbi:MAG: hypothetical protein K9H64_09980 [Bacteroidales bacterium]|nr:hypothetical protein [Bacteroidales bacterium]MCF8456196.1 hypothetical protein [Bacteroidales bacterium]
MDSNMILIWSIIILTTILLVVFIQNNNKKKLKKTISVLQDFAKELNSMISNYDHWDKTLIGIDNKGVNKLFFIRTTRDKEFREVINLAEVKDCRLAKTERNVHYNSNNVSAIDRIVLVFSFIDTHKPDIALEFYNSDYDQLILTGELQLAQKWSGIVQSILSTNKNRKSEVYKAKLEAPSIIKLSNSPKRLQIDPSKSKAKYIKHAI